jgi:hypothetical protein
VVPLAPRSHLHVADREIADEKIEKAAAHSQAKVLRADGRGHGVRHS